MSLMKIIIITFISIIIMSCESPTQMMAMTNYAIVKVFYATDRKENVNADIKTRYGAERGQVQYGTTEVSIPRDHRMGELESPSAAL